MSDRERRKAVTCLLCQEHTTYKRSGVCESCEQDWIKGRELRALAKAGGDDTHEVIRTVDYWYLYAFAGTGRGLTIGEGDPKSQIQKTLLALAGAEKLETATWRSGYSVPAVESREEVIGWTENCRKDFHTRSFIARRGSGELLRIAYRAIVDLLAEAYADGARKGQSMLHGLATGEQTVQDFNSWFTEIEEKKRPK